MPPKMLEPSLSIILLARILGIFTEALCDEIELVDVWLSREERLSREHLCKEAADGPDVDGAAVTRVPHQQLWSAIPPRGHVVSVRLTRRSCRTRGEIKNIDNKYWRALCSYIKWTPRGYQRSSQYISRLVILHMRTFITVCFHFSDFSPLL